MLVISMLPVVAGAQVGDLLKQQINSNSGKPVLRLDTRNSFIGNASVRVKGIQVGMGYGANLQLGLGFHSTRFAKRIPTERLNNSKVFLDYAAFFLEYEFFKFKKWRASYPMQLGFGAITLEEKNSGNYLAVPYEALMVVSYFPKPYFSFGLGLGYRVLLAGNNSYGLNFNSPIYSVKFNLVFQEILAALKK